MILRFPGLIGLPMVSLSGCDAASGDLPNILDADDGEDDSDAQDDENSDDDSVVV